MCDTFVSSLKITKKYQNELWEYLLDKLNSNDEFTIRFSIVMMLNYYINDTYKDRIYEIIKSIKTEYYYVKMASAWLLSYMFINYFNDTINFINHNKIDLWVLKKGIDKAMESFRLSSDDKKILKVIRDKINK